MKIHQEEDIMMKRSLLGIVTIAGCVVFAALALSCGTIEALKEPKPIVYEEIPYAELAESIQKVRSSGQGFIVEAYIVNDYFQIAETPDGTPLRLRTHGRSSSTYPDQFEAYGIDHKRYIDNKKLYRIFVGVYIDKETYKWLPYIDKIDGMMTLEEISALEAEQEAAAREAVRNPNKLNRSLYRATTVEDFSFDMVAGKLAAGTKVAFTTKFLTKPTGAVYRFEDIYPTITFTTTHNFVRDMPDVLFAPVSLYGWVTPKQAVGIYITVNQPGQSGECSVDIVNWN